MSSDISKEDGLIGTHRGYVFLDEETTQRLDAMKQAYSLKTRAKTIRVLLNNAFESLQKRQIATYQSVMSDPRAVVIAGLPYEGKSYTLGRFLNGCASAGLPFILFDTVGDHPDIPKAMNYYDFMGYRFTGNAQFRVLFPQDSALRRTAMRQIMDSLERAISEERLGNYVLAFEEAYEYSDLMPFLKFLAKVRKWSKKCVIASVDPEPFKNFCTVMRPLPKLA